ncbi:MAG: substrate-binding domain-containing protein [Albidovulum sp.]|nr:substrate-binding domain-containing protein [Albidovulum sp.]MDE0533140.1 substrate-binding domain-containing protein [Albidovulum sp.]
MGSQLGLGRLFGAAVAAVAGTWVGGATAQDTTIGVLFLDSQGFFGEIQRGILEGAADEDITLITDNAESDPARESEFLDTVIGAGAAAAIISPVSTQASVPAVERVVDAGIPVVCYNTCLAEEDTERLAAGLVTTDQAELGRVVGEVAAAALAGASARIGMLNCDRYEACQQRKAGFLATLDAAGVDYEVVADQEGFIADAATQVATEMLTADPDITHIWTANEGGTIGAVLGVQAAGQEGKTVVYGTDITMQIAQMLQDGSVLMAVAAQQPREMGREAIRMALSMMAGGEIEERLVHVATLVVDSADPDGIQGWIDAQ